MGGFVAGGPVASVFRPASDVAAGVYNPRVGPWEVKGSQKLLLRRGLTLLSGATAGIRFSASSTLTARRASLAFPRLGAVGQAVAVFLPAGGALAAIMQWHPGPSWRCYFGPSLTATNSLFRRLKGFRRIFSRFEKLDALFLGFLSFALIVEALRVV